MVCWCLFIRHVLCGVHVDVVRYGLFRCCCCGSLCCVLVFRCFGAVVFWCGLCLSVPLRIFNLVLEVVIVIFVAFVCDVDVAGVVFVVVVVLILVASLVSRPSCCVVVVLGHLSC